MIIISKDEASYLRDHGRAEDVHMSSRDKKARGKRYYATESFKTMKLVQKYRASRIIETYDGR